MWIIKTGNRVWWAVMAAIAGFTWLGYVLLAPLPYEQVRIILLCFSVLVFALYFVQRAFMFRDPEFLEAYGSDWKDRLVQLMPLHLCYISLIMAIVGLLLELPSLLSFCFYISFFGAMMALLSPEGYYQNKSVLEPPVLFFYLLHGMILALYGNIRFLGLGPMAWKYSTISVLILISLTVGIHFVNLLGRAMGLESINYIYTLDPSGSSLLMLLWKWIPVPLLYLVIPVGLTWLWGMLITGVYQLMIFFSLL